MKNKRTLKREIRNICTALMAECEATRYYGKATDDDLQSLTVAVLRTYSNAISRISHPEHKTNSSAYFKNLRTTLDSQVEEIVGQINALA